MSAIFIERKHAQTEQQIKQQVDQLIIKLNRRLPISSEWESADRLSFRSKGVKGNILLGDGQLSIALQLGIMYRAFKSSIEQEINQALDSYLS